MPGASSLDKGTVLRLAAKQGELEGRGETAGGERRGKGGEQRRGALDNQAANSPFRCVQRQTGPEGEPGSVEVSPARLCLCVKASGANSPGRTSDIICSKIIKNFKTETIADCSRCGASGKP